MIIHKELTLEEILKEMKKLRYRLLELADRLKIGYFEIKAITWKDVVTKSSFKGDTMIKQIIKTDDTREEFDVVKESYEDLRMLAIEKMADMLENKPIDECIVYFRDKLHWKWKDIAKMFNYSIRQCQNLYKKNNIS